MPSSSLEDLGDTRRRVVERLDRVTGRRWLHANSGREYHVQDVVFMHDEDETTLAYVYCEVALHGELAPFTQSTESFHRKFVPVQKPNQG